MIDSAAETNQYYSRALNPFFTQLRRKAYLTIGRWSHAESPPSLLFFNPGPVGGLDDADAQFVDQQFNSAHYQRVIRDFSFTKLLADNRREVWVHFTNEDPPEKGEDQVYVRYADIQDGLTIIEVAANEVTPILVDQLVWAFELVYGHQILDNGKPLSRKKREISNTIEHGVFTLLSNPACGIRHVTLMPLTTPLQSIGVIAINSTEHIRVRELEAVLQPAAEGILAHFLVREIVQQRHLFALRSAIAAIMSRNMSHNLGSHVVWHLAQQLYPKG